MDFLVKQTSAHKKKKKKEIKKIATIFDNNYYLLICVDMCMYVDTHTPIHPDHQNTQTEIQIISSKYLPAKRGLNNFLTV